MNTIVLPLTFFGNIEYFKFFVSDSVVIVDNKENYSKQTYRNRARILGSNGVLDLSIPVKSTKGITKSINEIEISYAENWPLKHWRSIKSAYKSAPFFEEYEDEIKALLFSEHRLLVDLNTSILNKIIDLLQIETKYHFTSEIQIPEEFIDKRTFFKPSKSPEIEYKNNYPQVFSYKTDFSPNLSVLDLLFNEGPYGSRYLESVLI